MNPRIEKLCLPRHRRDPIWKFWQPNAKLEKIHPPVYWKSLDYKHLCRTKKTSIKQTNHQHKRSCSDGCHYTTLIYQSPSENNAYRVFVDFEHDSLQHSTWKESLKQERVQIKTKASVVEQPWLNLAHQQPSLNYQELDRYFKSHIQKDKLFQLDTAPYPNRPIAISRRPRDALHIDFYQADHLKGSKTEATFKTFYHRKYLLPRHLHEHTLKDLLSIAENTQLNIEIIGHFILHPNELSKHEIQMFELTSEFGDIYEGHIIRINKDKLVLLLASTYHSHIKLSHPENLTNIIDEPKSTIEEIILNHVREYFQTHNDHPIEQIRRIQIELEPLTNLEVRRVIIHLFSNGEIIDNLSFDITHEQEPKLFDQELQNDFHFLQGIDENTIIHSVEQKLKQLFDKRFSLIHQEEEDSYLQLTLDMEYDTINSLEKLFHAYANHRLSTYSRKECMRIAIEYSFDDLLDEMDAEEFRLSHDNKQIQMMVDDVQRRLRVQIERRLKAETTAKILLIGPPMKKEINSTDKEVIVLDHHREIFITRSDTYIGSPKVKDIKRHYGNVVFHEEIEGGPKSFDRLPMSIDSLTILTRIQQRKRLADEQEDNNFIQLGSGIRRLVTFEDQEEQIPFSTECEQDKLEKRVSSDISLDEEDNNSIKTTSINTKSYNTSAHTKQKDLKKFRQIDQKRKKKRISRSPAEYGKYKQKRKRYKQYESISKIGNNSINPKRSFFNHLFLLHQNKKQKMIIFKKNPDRNGKHLKSSKGVNANAITEDANLTINPDSNDEILALKNSTNLPNNLFIRSGEDQTSSPAGRNFKMNVNEKEEVDDEQASNLNDDIMNGKDLTDQQKCNSVNRLNHSDESAERQQSQDEGFQDKEEIDADDSLEASETNYDTERYLRSLYGSLSSTIKHVHEIYQSKSTRLMASLDLAHIFITFLHIRKDTAYEIASAIIDARQHLLPPISTQKSSSTGIIDDKIASKGHRREENDNDDGSISSGTVTAEDSDTVISENSSTSRSISDDNDEDQNNFPDIIKKKKDNLFLNKNIFSSNSQRIMSRMTSYLSDVDWRVFHYITKHFLQNGGMITSHALEFSSTLLVDLIEDSIYQTYFHLKWCSDPYLNLNNKKTNEHIENTLIEEFFKKSIDNLFNRLQLINLPLLESIALMQTLKKYMSTDLLQQFNSMECHPVPMGRDPCIWFSTDILIKTICSLTDDILNKMNHDYLSDYTKLEYILISYFRKIEIVYNLQDSVKKNQHQTTLESSSTISNSKCLLHVIDLNQAPKFFSDQAFKRFKLGEQSYLNGDIEALKDLILLDIQKCNIKSTKRPYVPLSMDDLILHHRTRVISPSPWVLAQYHRRLGAPKTRSNKYNERQDSYQFDETTDTTKINNLPPEVRALLDNMIINYGTIEENLAMRATQDQYEGLSEEDVAQLIENALEAVERFDRENNIGDRKLQNKKTVNDRLTEFFKYAGRHGVRLLDDVLKLAKLRSNDPKKYLPLAVDMLKDRLKESGTTRKRKQGVRFAHTLETLLIATNDEPELITTMLKKKPEEKKLFVSEENPQNSSTTDLDQLQKITEEVETSSVEPGIDADTLSYPVKKSITDKYRQTLPIIEETVEPSIPSNNTADIDDQFYPQALVSKATISEIGLTVAQLIVLATGENQILMKLTNTQIEQMCLKQGLSKEQLQDYIKKLMQTTEIPDKFKLTEEQLVQIAIEENISIAQAEYIGTSQDHFQLNESQIRSLIAQINMINCTSLTSTMPLKQQQLLLVLCLDQLIKVCNQQKINIDNFLENKTALQKSSLLDSSKLKFNLLPSQIAYLINENQFDIKKLITIEQNLKAQDTQAQQFRLNSSQLAYLFANHRTEHSHESAGLSVAQLVGLYVLQQQPNKDQQTSLFSLTYQQIKQLALIQNMTLEHLQSLPSSKRPLQLTRNQVIYIATENKIPIKQIAPSHNEQKSTRLDQKQLCCLISQNNQSNTMQKSMHTTSSIDKSHRIQQRVCLNVEQVFSLAKYFDIELHQLTTCATEQNDRVEFRFKPEQLATLSSTSISSDDLKRITSLSGSPSQFILSDEQFSSLLRSVSTPVLSTHTKSTPSIKSDVEPTSQSLSSLSLQLVKSNEPINITPASTNIQNQLPSTLTDQLTAMHERLKSSVQAHIETVKIVSNSMLKRNRIESTLNLVHQLSLHSIDDISNKEIETIPSLVLDLLKMNMMTENTYKSIEQGEITSDVLDKSADMTTNSKEIVDLITNGNLTKTIIEGIQGHQFSFFQIHKIQTQLLTPKLIDEFKSGHLSQHILDAYKSLSPLQIINKVRSSVTQLNTLLLRQSSIIDQTDTMIVPIMQQTTTQSTIAMVEASSTDTSDVEKQMSSAGHVDIIPQTTQQDPITLYPESSTLRQQFLQELHARLDTQLIELKKEYGIEPIKGKASIQQITNKLRKMAAIQDLELLIGRQIDEIDILNILEGHINHLLVQGQVDSNKTDELFHRNTQHRLNRINERIQLVNILQNHIENGRLKRHMNLEEFTELVLEDIPKFEQLTNLHLTEDDLRIISMNRFASLERSINRPLAESEYRHLLQTNLPFDYMEQELLERSLTPEERLEHEELTLLPYQELVDDKTSLSFGKVAESLEQQNIKLNPAQLEQILQRRAELIDQYDLIHSISPSIQQIEDELDRSLTIDEKKRLIYDDYSIITQLKHKDIKEKSPQLLPITASLLELVEHTQDKNLLENIKHLETDLGRSLTKQEIIMAAKGDIIGLEKTLEKSLPTETIQSMYSDRFTNLANELNRSLTDKEIRDVLSDKLSSIEKALGRQLTSTERLTYKPVNVIDLTASQLTNPPSIDTTVQELEDVLERRLTSPEIQYLTDQQINELEKKSSIDKLNITEQQQIDFNKSEIVKDDFGEDWFISSWIFKQPIRFTLNEIETAIGKSLNSDELKRFAGSHFAQIENELGKSLNDLQRSNLLKGDKLTIESLINRKLFPEETGPHLVDITNIERILHRSLTFDELLHLAGDRFDEIRRILQRPFTQEELIDLLNGNSEKIRVIIEEELDRQKEEELKELPIKRIQYFENILHRKLSPNELVRFAEDRFEPLIRLLSDHMKPEQIFDLSSNRYDKIETFFGRSLISKEKYELEKSILQFHMKYSNILEELECIIQRRLSEDELRTLAGDQYHEIEMRLGKSLTEKQLRNILYGKYDQSVIGMEDLLNYLKRKYEDNQQRTRKIVTRLIEKLDEDYHESQKESTIDKNVKSSSRRSSIREKHSNDEFQQTTTDLLEQLSADVRKHAVVTPGDSPVSEILDDELKSQEQSLPDKETTPVSVASSPIRQTDSIKAFENMTRIVEQIADKEHIEEMTTATDAIDQFQEKLPKNNTTSASSIIEKPTRHQTTSAWFSNLNKDTTSPPLPAIKSMEDRPTIRESYTRQTHPEEDIYLGWTLFKSIDRSDLGLKDEKPRTINVRHLAQTYVVGIPEEYADEKSKTIANKIYQGGSIIYRTSKSRIIKEMGEFISQLFHIPLINDATHFIVPSRAYIDPIEPMNTYQSEIMDVEDDELQMRDSPETVEWYEECIQRNVQVHAQIPTSYQPSIVYCHTGRRTVITPAKRTEQRKVSIANSIEKSKTVLDQPASENISTFTSGFMERLSQPMLEIPSAEFPSAAGTVTDLIMHTVTTSQKTDLLEALDELFSEENLDKYQMTETHWQDIFLILLNSYLRSHLLNRKEIFKRLTDKLHELKIKERRRSSGFYPSISIASPPFIQIPNSLNESIRKDTKEEQFHFGLRSSTNTMNDGRTPNESEYSITPVTPGRQSIAIHESVLLPPNHNPSIQSLSQNHSAVPTSEIANHDLVSIKSFHSRSNPDKVLPSSMEHVRKSPPDAKLPGPINSNAVIGHQCSSVPMKHRRYRIIIMHSDQLLNASPNKSSTTMESTKLPSIVSKNRSSQAKQSTSNVLTDNQLLRSSLNNKPIRTKMLPNVRNK